MKWILFIPAFIGSLAAVQGIANRKLAAIIGLPSAVLVNAAVVGVCAIIYFTAHHLSLPIINSVSGRPNFSTWWLTGGICGFLIICLLPVSLNYLGAAQTFLIFVFAQIAVGLCYDTFWLGKGMSGGQMVFFLIAVIGIMGVLINRA